MLDFHVHFPCLEVVSGSNAGVHNHSKVGGILCPLGHHVPANIYTKGPIGRITEKGSHLWFDNKTKVAFSNVVLEGTTNSQGNGEFKLVESELIHNLCHQGNAGKNIFTYSCHIGKGSIIGDNCILDARQGIYIGENVNLSSEVHLWTEAHDVNDPYFRSMPCNHRPIHIGNRAWLGSNVTVLDNVSIGEGAVVCSGAVVTKDVEPGKVVAGVPAKVLRDNQ